MPSCGLVKNVWPGFHQLPLDLGSPRSGGGGGWRLMITVCFNI